MTTKNDVLLYIPNLIGYSRVLMLIASMVLIRVFPLMAVILYSIMGFLDLFDGWAARKYNQCSSFGGVLDMVTDRVATVAYIVNLIPYYPDYALALSFYCMLDLSSHWLQVFKGAIMSEKNHKALNSKYWLLDFFHKNGAVSCSLTIASEAFFIALHLMAARNCFLDHLMNQVGWIIFLIATPGFLFKQLVSITALINSAEKIAEYDASMKSKSN